MKKIMNFSTLKTLSIGSHIECPSVSTTLEIIAPANTEIFASDCKNKKLIAVVTGYEKLRISSEGIKEISANQEITYNTKDGKFTHKVSDDDTFIVPHVPNKISPEMQRMMEINARNQYLMDQKMRQLDEKLASSNSPPAAAKKAAQKPKSEESSDLTKSSSEDAQDTSSGDKTDGTSSQSKDSENGDTKSTVSENG